MFRFSLSSLHDVLKRLTLCQNGLYYRQNANTEGLMCKLDEIMARRDEIRALAGTNVQDVTIAEPDLEEIVLHFYEEGGEQA